MFSDFIYSILRIRSAFFNCYISRNKNSKYSDIMKLSQNELAALEANSLSIKDAKEIGILIESDLTANGIFPNNSVSEDYSNPDIEKFKSKWCTWWPVAQILLKIAKIFTKERGDKLIDEIIKLGNSLPDCQK